MSAVPRAWPEYVPSPAFAAWVAYEAKNRARLAEAMLGQPPANVTATLALHFSALSEAERAEYEAAAHAATLEHEAAEAVAEQS